MENRGSGVPDEFETGHNSRVRERLGLPSPYAEGEGMAYLRRLRHVELLHGDGYLPSAPYPRLCHIPPRKNKFLDHRLHPCLPPEFGVTRGRSQTAIQALCVIRVHAHAFRFVQRGSDISVIYRFPSARVRFCFRLHRWLFSDQRPREGASTAPRARFSRFHRDLSPPAFDCDRYTRISPNDNPPTVSPFSRHNQFLQPFYRLLCCKVSPGGGRWEHR